MRVHRTYPLILTLALVLPTLARAAFPDVPASHPYHAEINALVEAGVIGGNPDGTFQPSNPVNRASMLKMLYAAVGRKPSPTNVKCFPADIPRDAWFAPYVCDAFTMGYVKGYPDTTFRPGYPVTRAEALKLTLVILGIKLQDPLPTSLQNFRDVVLADWFAPYVHTAATVKIIPLRAWESWTHGATFSPNQPLERAEAAALIWNAQHPSASISTPMSAQSSSEGAVSSRKHVEFDDTGASAEMLSVAVPFTNAQTFDKKKSVSYRFTLAAKTIVDVDASLRSGEGSLRCTLYRMESDGMSTEYYLGTQDGGTCKILAAVEAGKYQLQLQPTVADTSFTVSVTEGEGDGNDGFSQAATIDAKPRVHVLDRNDLQDWFTFTVATERELTVSVLATDQLPCIVYAGSDVDLFSFTGPSCNQTYLYPPGTYHVGVSHPVPVAGRISYTVQLK